MNRASDDIVDFHFSISHNTFKYNTYLFAFPSVRNIKTMTIDAVFIAKIMFPVGIILLFFLVFLINIIAPEIPLHSMIRSCTGKIPHFCLLSFCRAKA